LRKVTRNIYPSNTISQVIYAQYTYTNGKICTYCRGYSRNGWVDWIDGNAQIF